MGSNRQTAIELQQDIIAKKKTIQITKLLEGKTKEDIEQICSLPIDGRNVFQTIAANDKASVLGYILKCGVDITSVDKLAMHVAVSHKARKTTKLLLEHGAKLSMTGSDGKTPLHIAAEMGHVDILKDLLEHEASKEVLDQAEVMSGCTPLSLACMTGQETVAILLIENNAKINMNTGYPPIHAAAFIGNVNVVRTLISKGADVDLKDKYDESALHYACYKGHKKVVRALLECGATINSVDKRGKTPTDLAKTEDIKKLLQDAKQK